MGKGLWIEQTRHRKFRGGCIINSRIGDGFPIPKPSSYECADTEYHVTFYRRDGRPVPYKIEDRLYIQPVCRCYSNVRRIWCQVAPPWVEFLEIPSFLKPNLV